MPMAAPRCAGENMSAIVPPELVMVLEPKVPAKKRRTSSVFMSCAPQHAALKAVKGM